MRKYDVVAVTGRKNDKPIYKNVGCILEKEGKHYLLLDKTFNPAGLAEKDRDSVILSLFAPKAKGQAQNITNGSAPHPAAQVSDDFGDEIPF